MLTKILKKGSIVIAQEDCKSYLTPGKEYNVTRVGFNSFIIIDDDGDELYCLPESCEHLDGKDWVIKSNS